MATKASTKELIDIVNVWNESNSAQEAADTLGYTVKTLEGQITRLRGTGIVHPKTKQVYHFPLKSFKTGTGGGGKARDFDPDAIMASIAKSSGKTVEQLEQEAAQLAAAKVERDRKTAERKAKAEAQASAPEENVETTTE